MGFRTCTCGKTWSSRDEFLSDPKIKIIGYQVNFEHLKEGFFLFNHMEKDCLTTMGLPAGLFLDLYRGAIFQDRLTGSFQCAGQCLHERDLSPCPEKCECAFVREVVDMVVHWKKRTAA